MPTGRCVCGRTGPATKIAVHVLNCRPYADLFRTDPSRCLDPVAEYLRYRTDENTSENHARDRDKRVSDRYAITSRTAAAHAARFAKPRDILED